MRFENRIFRHQLLHLIHNRNNIRVSTCPHSIKFFRQGIDRREIENNVRTQLILVCLNILAEDRPQLNCLQRVSSILGRTIPGYLADRLGVFVVMISVSYLSAILCLALWIPARSNAAIIVSLLSMVSPLVALSRWDRLSLRRSPNWKN